MSEIFDDLPEFKNPEFPGINFAYKNGAGVIAKKIREEVSGKVDIYNRFCCSQ